MKNSKKFVLTTGGFPWCGGRRSTAGCEWCSLTCCSRGSGSILCFKIRSFGQKFWKYLGANRITISCVLFFFSRKRKCRASCDPTLAEGEAFFSNKMKLTIDHQHHCLADSQATWAWCQMKKHRWGIDHSLQACLTDKKTNKQQKTSRQTLVSPAAVQPSLSPLCVVQRASSRKVLLQINMMAAAREETVRTGWQPPPPAPCTPVTSCIWLPKTWEVPQGRRLVFHVCCFPDRGLTTRYFNTKRGKILFSFAKMFFCCQKLASRFIFVIIVFW